MDQARDSRRAIERPGMTLVEGDPMGPMRDVLAEMVVAAAIQGTPPIVVLTDETAPQYRKRLRRLDVSLDDASAVRPTFVDACAPSVGWAHTDPDAVFVETDGADGILMALSELQAALVETYPDHVIVVDNMSTLTLLNGPREAFVLARTLKSFTDRLGASVVLGLTRGMHPEEATVPLMQLSDVVLALDRQGTIDTVRGPPAE